MDNRVVGIETLRPHVSHADFFEDTERAYIKSFVLDDYAIGYHTHSFYELNIVLSGHGRHYIEELSCEAKKGSVFVIPPGIRHGYTKDADFNVYHMLIHRDFLETCFGEFRNTAGYSLLFEIEPYLRAQYTENLFLVLSETELAGIMNDIALIRSCRAISESDVYVNAVAKKILAFLCMLITSRHEAESFQPQSKKELLSITNCLRYIHHNFDQRLTVDLLAEKLHMSRSTFIRQFTKICGCSPYAYIKQYRIKRAGEYLENENESSTTVAHKCGFYDASHMRKYLGR